MAQSERNHTPKAEVGKKPNRQSGTYTKKTYRKPSEQLFPNRRPLSCPNLTSNIKLLGGGGGGVTENLEQKKKKNSLGGPSNRREAPAPTNLSRVHNKSLTPGVWRAI